MKARRVMVPLFDISSNPKINLTNISQRWFSLIPKRCPVCRDVVDDIQAHIDSTLDSEHMVHSIMEL